jgi:tetratricopeptide (TPR) repeat protein
MRGFEPRFFTTVFALFGCACASTPFRSLEQGGPRWIDARSEHFRLLTSQSDSRANSTLVDLEAAQAVLEQVAFPSTEKPPGITEIVELPSEDFQGLQNAGVVGSEFAAFESVAGLEFEAHQRFVVRDDLRDDGLSLLQSGLARRFAAFYFPNAPVWLSVGLAEFWRTLEIKGHIAYFGGSFAASTEPTPLDELIRLEAPEFYVNDATRLQANFEAASIAVRVLYFEYRAPFNRYLTELRDGQTAEADAWRSAMTGNVQELRASFSRFLDEHGRLGEVPAPAVAPEILITELDASELHLLRASLWPATFPLVQNAEREVDGALKVNPDSTDALVVRALLHARQTRDTEARMDLERALALSPMRSSVLAAALEYELAGKPPLHLSRQQLVTRLLKFQLTAGELNLVAEYYESTGQVDQGLRLLARAVRLDSSCARCYATGSRLFEQRGDNQAAIRALRTALALAGQSADPDDRQRLYVLEANMPRGGFN